MGPRGDLKKKIGTAYTRRTKVFFKNELEKGLPWPPKPYVASFFGSPPQGAPKSQKFALRPWGATVCRGPQNIPWMPPPWSVPIFQTRGPRGFQLWGMEAAHGTWTLA